MLLLIDHLDPTVLAALIAFLGATLGFFWRKNTERRSVNRAILAEIQRLIHVVRRHRDWWAKLVQDKDTDYPLIPFSHAVYSTQVKNIGELKGDVVVRAVMFYGHLDFLNALQATRSAYDPPKTTKDNKPMSEVFDAQYLRLLNNFLRDFEHAFDSEFQGLA